MPGLGGWLCGRVLDCPGFATRADETEAAPLENPDRSEVRRGCVRDDTNDLRLRERSRHERLNEFGREPEPPRFGHDGVADFGNTVGARRAKVAARTDEDGAVGLDRAVDRIPAVPANRFGVLGEPVTEELHSGPVVFAWRPAGRHCGPEKACEGLGRLDVCLDKGQGRRDEVEAVRSDDLHGVRR